MNAAPTIRSAAEIAAQRDLLRELLRRGDGEATPVASEAADGPIGADGACQDHVARTACAGVWCRVNCGA